MQHRTAVIIAGRHLDARGWEEIVWGDVEGRRLGQIPHAIKLAWDMESELIIWGTGASSRDGILEADYMYQRFVDGCAELADLLNEHPDDIRDTIESTSIFNTRAKNTVEEMEYAFEMCLQHDISYVYITSAATHIARCHQVALTLRAENAEYRQFEIFASASDTNYADATARDVVIVEPPHRGDMPRWQTHRYVREMFSIMQDTGRFEEFLLSFGKLLEEFDCEDPNQPRAY